jgi:hypothetical protein
MTTEQILRLLKVAATHEATDNLKWNTELEFFTPCSDVFFWGCADAEDIKTDEDIALFEKSLADDNIYGNWLYAARKRHLRPQGACYNALSPGLVALFDACGSKREAGLGNPVDH